MPKRATFRPTKKGPDTHPWRVNIPAPLSASGKRERRFFKTKAEGDSFCDAEKIRLKNFGVSTESLSAAQREAAAAAFRLLGSSSPGRLVDIVQAHLETAREKSGSVTLAQLEENLKSQKVNRSAPYLRQIRQSFQKLSRYSDTLACDLAPSDIEEALSNIPSSSRNAHLRVLKAAFNLSVKRGWCRENPVKRLDFTQVHRGEVEVLTHDQVKSLLVACCSESYVKLMPYHVIGLFAGLRPAELERLQWEHIHLQERNIVLPAGLVTRKGRRRIVPIEPTLEKWLRWVSRKERRNTGPIIPYSGSTLRRKLRALRKAAKMETWIQDVMRHTYASNWLAQFEDEDRLRMNLGHRTSAVLFNHYHSAIRRKDAARFWGLDPRTVTQR